MVIELEEITKNSDVTIDNKLSYEFDKYTQTESGKQDASAYLDGVELTHYHMIRFQLNTPDTTAGLRSFLWAHVRRTGEPVKTTRGKYEQVIDNILKERKSIFKKEIGDEQRYARHFDKGVVDVFTAIGQIQGISFETITSTYVARSHEQLHSLRNFFEQRKLRGNGRAYGTKTFSH